jgi:S1-C subfamily serine protease
MRKALVPAVLAVALLSSACSVQFGKPSEQPRPSTSVTSFEEPLKPGASVETVVKRVLPAVVNVTSSVTRTDASGGSQEGQGVGTGFIVRADGIIVTNCHVVEGAAKVTVSTSEEEPRSYDARVIGGDCLHDLAVLQIDETDLPTVSLGDSADLRLGQSVVALGYALALEGGPTVTTGIVSSLDRTIQAQDDNCTSCGPDRVRTYSNVIQTDAAINHGNSGGPLVDMQGRVVGINSAGNDTAQNIGFAIAIDSAKETIAQAQDDPLAPSAYLGVTSQDVTGVLATQLGLSVDAGAYVVAVTEDGPAAGAGITEGDVIVAVDQQAVTSSGDLGSILAELEPGKSVAVQVVTGSGAERTIDVELGTRPLPVELP